MINACHLKHYNDPLIQRNRIELPNHQDLIDDPSLNDDEGSVVDDQSDLDAPQGDPPNPIPPQPLPPPVPRIATKHVDIKDSQQTFEFKTTLKTKYVNKKRYTLVLWTDGSRTWEPDESFDADLLADINRKFTKKGTKRKTCFKRNK